MAEMMAIDRVRARTKLTNQQDEYCDATLLALGPLGAEVQTPSYLLDYPVGTAIDTQISSDGENTFYEGVIANCQRDGSMTIRFLAGEPSDTDRRKSTRWICPPLFLPKAMATAPGQFNEFIEFQVRNISNGGLELRCQTKSNSLVRGMLLRLAMSLPLVGETDLIVKIVRIDVSSIKGKEALSIGVEFVNLQIRSRELLAQYLLQFSAINSFDDMRSRPSRKEKLVQNIKCCFLKSKRDYDAFLGLKSSAGESVESSQPSSQDLYSRIAIAYSENEPIACVRITFPDHQHSVLAQHFSESFPRIDQIVELSDFVCPEQKNAEGVVMLLLSYAATTCLSCERPYLWCRPSGAYSSIWKKIGMIPTNINGALHQEYIGHPFESAIGTGAESSSWYLVWHAAAKYLWASGTEKPVGGS